MDAPPIEWTRARLRKRATLPGLALRGASRLQSTMLKSMLRTSVGVFLSARVSVTASVST